MQTAEEFEELLSRPGLLIERIVSHGQVTPTDSPYLQSHDEWVMVIAGTARLLVEGEEERELNPGDHMLVPGGARHWVTHTSASEPTVWIAVHIGIADKGD